MVSRTCGKWLALLQGIFLPSLLFALTALLLFPHSASAHAILLDSDPKQDAVLASSPAQVRMWFSESLNPTFSTAYVVNAATGASSAQNDPKTHVDKGDARVNSTNSKEMDLSLQPNLPSAVYVVLYVTQSADDGHILHGSFIFKVEDANGNVPTFNGSLPGPTTVSGAGANGTLDGPTLFSLIMVTLVDLGVVFWVGAQLWLMFVVPMLHSEDEVQQAITERTQARFEHRFSVPTLLMLLLANIGFLIGQAITLTNGQWVQAFSPSLLVRLVSQGHFGTYWIIRELLILLALILAVYAVLAKRQSAALKNVLSWLNFIIGLALLSAVALSGHAAAVRADIVPYAVLIDFLHLLAAALWIGEMMYIAIIYLPVLQKHPVLKQTQSLLETLPRYSPLAIAGVLIMAASGPFNAATRMTLDQLFSTAYGRTLIVKVLLVVALLVTSAIHVIFFRPRLAKDLASYHAASDASQATKDDTNHVTPLASPTIKRLEQQVTQQTIRLRTILRWEPLLGVAVLLCTGLLTVFSGTLQPATPTQPTQTQPQVKPYTKTVQTTDNLYRVDLSISPNRFGENTFTVTVHDSKGALVPTGTIGVSLYTTMLDMDMGTDSVNLQPDGKGHFSAKGDLSMGGNWEVRIEIRTLDNTLHGAKIKLFTPS